MSASDALRNLGVKVGRRVAASRKPLIRLWRRRERAAEHAAVEREVAALDRGLARLAAGTGPIVAGPWLAEVGYEVLYWIPFLRWFTDAYRVAPDRLVVLSRGGLDAVYAGLSSSYLDIFDLLSPRQLASRNAARQASREGGGQKQSDRDVLDDELLRGATARLGLAAPPVLHPSVMFRMFRHAWHGNIAMDFFWRRTAYARIDPASLPLPAGVALPAEFVAVKLYTGPAISSDAETRSTLRALVGQLASARPVIAFETRYGLDEHADLDLSEIPGVISAAPWMTPRTNLGVQLALLARARTFVGTCGGLAWLAPFLGVPTVAVYDNDHLLAPHLLVARQARKRARASEFSVLDLRAVRQLDIGPSAAAPLG